MDFGCDGRNALAVGVGDDRRDQPAGDRHRDRNVGAAVFDQRVAGETDVALGNFDQRRSQRLDHQVVDAELDVAAGEPGVELRAKLEQRVELDVDGQVNVRDLLLRLGQAARDRLAHVAELDDLVRDVARVDRRGVRLRCRRRGGGGLLRRFHRQRCRGRRERSARPGPEPFSEARSMPWASASRRASGEALMRTPPSPLEGEGWGEGAAAGVCRRRRASLHHLLPAALARGELRAPSLVSAIGSGSAGILPFAGNQCDRRADLHAVRAFRRPGSWKSSPRRPLRTPSSPCRFRSRRGCRRI